MRNNGAHRAQSYYQTRQLVWLRRSRAGEGRIVCEKGGAGKDWGGGTQCTHLSSSVIYKLLRILDSVLSAQKGTTKTDMCVPCLGHVSVISIQMLRPPSELSMGAE